MPAKVIVSRPVALKLVWWHGGTDQRRPSPRSSSRHQKEGRARNCWTQSVFKSDRGAAVYVTGHPEDCSVLDYSRPSLVGLGSDAARSA